MGEYKSQVIESNNVNTFEQGLNRWLQSNKIEIKDIKYSTTEVNDYINYSALIIYRQLQ